MKYTLIEKIRMIVSPLGLIAIFFVFSWSMDNTFLAIKLNTPFAGIFSLLFMIPLVISAFMIFPIFQQFLGLLIWVLTSNPKKE